MKVSRLFREEKIAPDVLQFLRDTAVGKVKRVAVSPVQEDDELDHGQTTLFRCILLFIFPLSFVSVRTRPALQVQDDDKWRGVWQSTPWRIWEEESRVLSYPP
jgi:hypothetical protein